MSTTTEQYLAEVIQAEYGWEDVDSRVPSVRFFVEQKDGQCVCLTGSLTKP